MKKTFLENYTAQYRLAHEDILFQQSLTPEIPPSIQSYPHPEWLIQRKYQSPKVLDINPSVNPDPVPEGVFRGALLRLCLSKEQCSYFAPMEVLTSGTMVTFDGFPFTEGHHIITWCQAIRNGTAYLRLVGRRTSDLTPYAWDDERFPTVILELPSQYTCVKYPSGIHSTSQSIWTILSKFFV